ncbi:MAG: DoxX family protein [Dehalococcoidales bacterium]|jgi:uncharacterized membrane protein YphA (DoxX/SURF4 family)|nr:DoxX family protein [Dehalococcoidales bacterium]MDP7415503.1 DoxX family protein [Dehalococcoidales bacterium]|tara:strand:+ start:363 stop:857 length:495 start_codon:yes stop_codon:yes gene_type:complete
MGIRCYKHQIGVSAGITLGLIFITAGVGKLLHQPEAFTIFFTPFPRFLSLILAKAAFIWLPWVELVIGLLLISGIAARPVAAFSLLLITGFIVNNTLLLIQGLGGEPCHCFGAVDNIVEADLSIIGALGTDIAMLALALVFLLYSRRGFFNLYPWFLKESDRGK